MSQLEVSMRNMPSVQATKSENEISMSRLYRLVMALAKMQKPSEIIFPRNKLLAFDRPWLTQHPAAQTAICRQSLSAA